jgi:glycerate 2-kinase
MPFSRSVVQLRTDARVILEAALAAVDAQRAVARNLSFDSGNGYLKIGPALRLPLSKFERVFVIGAGKATASMAVAVEDVLGSPVSMSGIVNVKYGHTSPRPQYISLNECGHPLPDERGVAGSKQIGTILDQLTERDLLLVLISGGASSLLPWPADGIKLEEKIMTTDSLLRAGATIDELNAVRKHLSNIKGGQLALRAKRATVIALILSDVVGDRLDVIGSGPTVADPSTFADACDILKKYGLLDYVPFAVRIRLEKGCRGQIAETPKGLEFIPNTVHNFIVGSNRLAIESAQRAALALGYNTLILSSTLQGEAREVARVHAEILREVVGNGNPIQRPACILSGGETTVTVRGVGKGGRNLEFALAVAISINGLQNAIILAAPTVRTVRRTPLAASLMERRSRGPTGSAYAR